MTWQQNLYSFAVVLHRVKWTVSCSVKVKFSGMKNGVLTGVGAGGSGSFAGGLAYTQEVAATTWTITHNRNNSNVAGITVINSSR